jgi:hypothetical protein
VFTFNDAMNVQTYADRPGQFESVIVAKHVLAKDNFLDPRAGTMGDDA